MPEKMTKNEEGRGGISILQRELALLVAAEEARLGVGSREFLERHMEIMKMAESIERGGKQYAQSVLLESDYMM